MLYFLSGIFTCAAVAVSLFFLRFWRKSGDRIFALFACAFSLFAAERVILFAEGIAVESKYLIYTIRFIAHLIIIWGIVDKNVRRT